MAVIAKSRFSRKIQLLQELAVHFVTEAYKRVKAVDALSAGTALLFKAGVAEQFAVADVVV